MRKCLSFFFPFLLVIMITACRHDNEKEIKSLIVANDAVMEMQGIIDNHVNYTFNIVKGEYALLPHKMKDTYEKSVFIKSKSDSLVQSIIQLKYNLLAAVSGKSIFQIERLEKSALKEGFSFLEKIDGLNDEKTPWLLLFADNGKVINHLEKQINEYKEAITSVIGPKYINNIRVEINFDKSEYLHAILAADVVLLNSLILEIREVENNCISYMYSISSVDEKWPVKQEAYVKAENVYIKQGTVYEAKIFVANYDSKQQPKVYINQPTNSSLSEESKPELIIEGKDGFCTYRTVANSPGWHSYSGYIEIVDRIGNSDRYPFNSSYFVEPK